MGPFWANQIVAVKCDNQAAVAMINKGNTASPVVMAWLRDLFWMSAIHNFRITARYVPGIANVLADSISHLHDPSALLQFYSILCGSFTPVSILGSSLTNNMSVHSASFLLSRFRVPCLVGQRTN